MFRRAQSGLSLPSLSIALFVLFAFLCFTQPVQAEEVHPEYGTVIGIGSSMFLSLFTESRQRTLTIGF
jgi:hypothetical protein